MIISKNNSTKISNRQIIKTTKVDKITKNPLFQTRGRIDHSIFLTPENTIREIEEISFGLYSYNDVLKNSSGEILSTETLHFRTLKPIPGGLYCEKIFGPIENYTCSCEKFVGYMYDGIVCDECGVKIQRNETRYYAFGHINFAIAMLNPLFFTRDSFLLTLLNINYSTLTKIFQYQTRFICEVTDDHSNLKIIEDQDEKYYDYFEDNISLSFREENLVVGYGAEFLYGVLEIIDMEKIIHSTKSKKLFSTLSQIAKSNNLLTDVIMKSLIVLPAGLRPIKVLSSTSSPSSVDSNQFYKTIYVRNEQLKLYMSSPPMIIPHEMKIHSAYLLQKILYAFFDQNDKNQQYLFKNKLLKSIMDIISGKQGILRHNIAGKRSNFSGRAVLAMDSKFRINECGLPFRLALDIFKPLIIGRMIDKNIVSKVNEAATIIENTPLQLLDFVKNILQNQRVIINRAPTLHTQGIQSLKFKIVVGNALIISPGICAGMNADMDGDTSSIFSTIYPSSLLETVLLMDASLNIFSAGNGKCLAIPNREIILSCYIMTRVKDPSQEAIQFININHVLNALKYQKIDPLDKVSFAFQNQMVVCAAGLVKLNQCFEERVRDYSQPLSSSNVETMIANTYDLFGSAVATETLHRLQNESLNFITQYGYSLSIASVSPLMDKEQEIREKIKNIKRLLSNTASLNINDVSRQAIQLYFSSSILQLSNKYVKENLQLYPDNDIHIAVNSKSRGNFSQVLQIGGLIGFVGDAEGNIINSPILSNYLWGLNSIEYFLTSFGAISGVIERGIATQIAGYETRKLVYALNDVIVRERDCGSEIGETMDDLHSQQVGIAFQSKYQRIIGRHLAEDLPPYSINTLITPEIASDLQKRGINPQVFLIYNCQSDKGVCQKCYGIDWKTRKKVDIGELVGIIAAQSLGEPSLQMTMRTFHTSGVIERENNLLTKVIHAKTQSGTVSFDVDACVQYSNLMINQKKIDIFVDGEKIATLPVFSFILVENQSIVNPQQDIAIYLTNYSEIYSKYSGTISEDILNYHIVDSFNKIVDSFSKHNNSLVLKAGDEVTLDQFIGIRYEMMEKGSIISDIDTVVDILNVQGYYHESPLTVSPIAGKVKITQESKKYKITIQHSEDEKQNASFQASYPSDILVVDGQEIDVFTQVIKGPVNFFTYQNIYGTNRAKRYIAELISATFLNSGIYFDSKHVEILSNRMCSQVQILDEAEDPNYLVKHFYPKKEIIEINRIKREENKKEIIYKDTIRSIANLTIFSDHLLSAISFQNSKKLLTKHSLFGSKSKVDSVLDSTLIGNMFPYGTSYHFTPELAREEIEEFKTTGNINKYFFYQQCLETLRREHKKNVNFCQDSNWYDTIIDMTRKELHNINDQSI